MRKILCLLLSLCLLVGIAAPAFAEMEVTQGYKQPKADDLLEVTLQIHSNRSGKNTLDGLYFDNVFYIDCDSVCELTGCRYRSKDAEHIEFSLYSAERLITVTDDCRLSETCGQHKYNMDIPTATVDGELYVSAPHILRYLGAFVDFAVNADAAVHMSVSMPYTIFDAYNDYDSASYSLDFQWFEADGGIYDPQDLKYFAVISTVYFGYDSHLVIQGISPQYQEAVMESMYEDILLQILQTNYDEAAPQENAILKMFGDVSGEILVTDAWIQSIMAVVEFEGVEEMIDGILQAGETTTAIDTAGAAKTFIKLTGAMASAFQTVLQYDAISAAQSEVLWNSLGCVPSAGYIYEMSPDVFDAADSAQSHIEDSESVARQQAKKILFDMVVDIVSGGIPVVNTVSGAMEVFNTVVQSVPWFQEKLERNEHITVCHVSNTVASLCRTMLEDDWKKVAIGTEAGMDHQVYAKANLIMMMKATLLTRISLMDSGILTSDAYNLMAVKNEQVASMLNKASNARLVEQPQVPLVKEDLTWIAKLAGKGIMGYAVDNGRYIYYWQYDPSSYEEGALLGNFSMSSPATLVRLNNKGEEEKLFECAACEFAVTATHIIYQQDGEIWSRLIDGSKPEMLVEGALEAVNSYGQYIVYHKDGVYYSYDLWDDGGSVRLYESGNFEAFHNGVVYYSIIPEYGDPDYEMATKGSVSLYAVNVDGTDNRKLVTTAADLYDSNAGYSPAHIEQVRFSRDSVYFSYGSIAGSGAFFQGGKIIRVSFDGKDIEVVAGQNRLVDANFGVRADGSVATTDDRDFVMYTGHMDYFLYDGGLYWMDHVSGMSELLIVTSEIKDRYSSAAFYVPVCYATNTRAVFMVNYTDVDPDQSMGWREYAVRKKTVVYMLDREKMDLTELYSF